MEKLFKLKEHGTDVKTEIIAGITTFLAMAYIVDTKKLLWYNSKKYNKSATG